MVLHRSGAGRRLQIRLPIDIPSSPSRAAKPSLVPQRFARNPARASFRGRSPLWDFYPTSPRALRAKSRHRVISRAQPAFGLRWSSTALGGGCRLKIRMPIDIPTSPAQSGKELPQSQSASRKIPPPLHFAGAARSWTFILQVPERFARSRIGNLPSNCVRKHELPG